MLTLSAISSAALAFWASEQKAKIKETNAMVDTLNATFEYPMSCLGSLLTSLPHQDVKKLVFIRGVILPTSFANIGGLDKVSSSSSSSPNQGVGSAINILRSPKTGQHAVVVEKTTTHVYNETSTNLMGDNKKQEGTKIVSKARKQVPFIIADHISVPCNEYVVINLEGADVEVPLQKVSYDKKHIFTHNHNGRELQVDEVTEEEILPVGTVVTAVGIFSSENGIPTIKPFQDLPYFLTSKTKNEMIAEVSAKFKNLRDTSDSLSRWSVGCAFFAFGVYLTRLAQS
ncbi:E3 ubiquitin-protein ligase SPL2-like [Spinacia oleracea]|uniref:RING-type E3 ubiquitin transferase n=1 Tax=Spinacia oleracea TaxID=3562 RepID=A0A9R0JAE3_SPIOL|nr:E3 ubiquitin-protein ligase SPL2-like [Spinacia oleracea]